VYQLRNTDLQLGRDFSRRSLAREADSIVRIESDQGSDGARNSDAILHSTSVVNGACMVVTDTEPDRLAAREGRFSRGIRQRAAAAQALRAGDIPNLAVRE
jgi:hypothetical protein